MTLASSTGHESDMLVVCIFSHNAELRLCSTRSSRTLNKQKCELLLSPKSQRRRLWCQSPRLDQLRPTSICHWSGLVILNGLPVLSNPSSIHLTQALRGLQTGLSCFLKDCTESIWYFLPTYRICIATWWHLGRRGTYLLLVLELGINHWRGIPRLVNASTHNDQKLRLMFSRKSSNFSRTATLLTNQKVSKITHCGPCIAMALVSIKAPLLVSVHILAIILTILYVLQPFGS